MRCLRRRSRVRAVCRSSVTPRCCRGVLAPSPSAAARRRHAAVHARRSRRSRSYDKPAVVGAAVQSRRPDLPPAGSTSISVGYGDRRMGHRGLLPFPRQEVPRDDDVARTVSSVDSTGRLDARFAIPEDYGGVHEVIALVDGKPVAQNGVEVTQTFEMTPASGPGRHADRAARSRGSAGARWKARGW